MSRAIPVVDLFAGPGGLGEGFASLQPAYRIQLSAEKEPYAHRTLRLRAFKRLLERHHLPDASYYRYLHGESESPYDVSNKDAWRAAGQEAQQLTLGEPADDLALRKNLRTGGLEGSDWVLVGGPPCQAYSVVGRVRNNGVVGYRAEDDERHYLYREYLKLIQEFRPTVFVMENVKGLLSSTVHGERIFDEILRDLTDPDRALNRAPSGPGYTVHSLIDSDAGFVQGSDPGTLRGNEFTICSENFGLPQTRHRVILLGVREDCLRSPELLHRYSAPAGTVREVISDLPRIRSRLTRRADSDEAWQETVAQQASIISREAREASLPEVAAELASVAECMRRESAPPAGGLRVTVAEEPELGVLTGSSRRLREWFNDPKLNAVLNHDARAHMDSDLRRYLYAACFAKCYGTTPKSHTHFRLPSLVPQHRSWKSGQFADRFRVQLWDEPGKTITSHIHKDGHYFIHPDPMQCRSFTVREAARIQTFPDNYFFEGNRTEQFIQVGNAVPPLLARFIAEIVLDVITASAGGGSWKPADIGVG